MNMVLYFILIGLVGAFMGLLTHAKRNKHIKLPKINKRSWNPGFLMDLSFGAIASIAAVLVSSPSSLERSFLLALLAGYMGEKFVEGIANSNYFQNKSKEEEIKEQLNQKIDIKNIEKENGKNRRFFNGKNA